MANALQYPRDTTGFQRAVRDRVNAYFEETGLPRHGHRRMIRRSVVLLTAVALTYAALLSNRFHGLDLFVLQCLFGYAVFLVSILVAHDASHDAYAASPRVNRWLTRTFDLIGISSHAWRYNHLRSHHSGPNVPVFDAAIDSAVVFRLHPSVRWLPWMRWQWLYIPAVYAMATLQKWFLLDFFSVARSSIGAATVDSPGWRTWVWLLATKVVTLTWMVLIPLALIDAPLWQLLAGFVAMHAVSGLFIAVVFQTTHLAERTEFVAPDAQGRMPYSFAEHTLRTTADFATDSAAWTVLSGGLNHHVAHHLFPRISQVHLPALTRIVRETAAEHGLEYVAFPTAREAWASHLRLLARLGAPEREPVPVRIDEAALAK